MLQIEISLMIFFVASVVHIREIKKEILATIFFLVPPYHKNLTNKSRRLS